MHTLIEFCVKSQPHMEHALIKSMSPTTHLNPFQAPGNRYFALKVVFLWGWHKGESMWYMPFYIWSISVCKMASNPVYFNSSKDRYLNAGEMAEG